MASPGVATPRESRTSWCSTQECDSLSAQVTLRPAKPQDRDRSMTEGKGVSRKTLKLH
ncbi:protein-(glutamine-N5) methyltransferase [Anopheles sinensis]|uniref:Protein-(Glutamine-N5) methyltransferase n=1 Tax=Anopheles sinensis TaxID=74873 RepID=A0A084W338_ANOSI|nr:protein-(glutamine-N5) methyltransferase [Anopheles sinensis]